MDEQQEGELEREADVQRSDLIGMDEKVFEWRVGGLYVAI